MAYAAYWMRLKAEAPGGDNPGQISNVSTSKSQAKQTTPTPAAPVPTVKPAEYEKGAASSSSTAGSAAKPAAATPAASTAATVSAGASTGAKVSGGVSAGAAGSLSTQSGSSKDSPKTPSVTPVKAPSVSTGSGAASGVAGVGAGKPTTDPVKPKDTSKDKVQSTSISSSKPEPSKVTTVGAGSTAKKDDAKPKEAKVQVEVPPPAAKTSAPPAAAADPFDALAGSLPSAEPLAPKPPKYTGPEVKESGLTSEEAKRCGEKEHTLPPGYRKEDMEKKAPAGVPEKPKEVAKPLTDEDVLESLSAGFVSSAAPNAPKSQATPPMPSAKAPPPVSAGGGVAGGIAGTGVAGAGSVIGKPATDAVKPKDTVKDTAQSTAIPSSKSEPPKVTSSGVAKPSAPANVSGTTAQKDDAKSKEAKIHADVTPPAAKASAPAAAADPFDALAGSLPSAEPLAPKPPQYTGPEVKEPGLTSQEAKRCGEHDFTLPPGYRKEDMEKKVPAGKPEKPKEVPKPLTDDDVLESLSAGFGSSTVPSAPGAEVKVETAAVAKSSHAPPPPPSQKRQEVPAPTAVSPAPPADKKAKVEKPVKDSAKAAPPTSKPSKPKAEEDDPMSFDALTALSDSLPSAKPVHESPKLRPEDIVKEKEAKSEKGVRVGEREDSLPPEYRFPKEKVPDKPAPPKEPSMDSGEALDILSGDFTSPSVAPAVKASAPPSAPAKQQPKVEDLSALDALAGDFVAPAQAKKVASGVPPAAPPLAAKSPAAPTPDKGESMSLDALSALEEMLPTAKPAPESPKLRPEDIIDEKKLTSEKGVRVGEREDTLPPEYRFPKEDPKKHPAPAKREPSLDSAGALDILSGDFTSPSVAPAVKAPVPPSAPPADSSADFGVDELAADFVAPTSASKVQSAVTGPPKADRQLSVGTASAMDALSDTLMDITPVPEPKPVSPKDIIKEKTVVEERVNKAGERDDSLPPEFRPTEADIKAAAKAKAELPSKQVSMDESAALDLLSGDFSSSSAAAPVAPPPSQPPHSTPAKTQSASQASGPVLDKLANTLLPDLPGNDSKPKDSKPKVKGGKSKPKPKKPAVDDVPAVGELPGKPSTDVVSSSPTKKGGKS